MASTIPSSNIGRKRIASSEASGRTTTHGFSEIFSNWRITQDSQLRINPKFQHYRTPDQKIPNSTTWAATIPVHAERKIPTERRKSIKIVMGSKSVIKHIEFWVSDFERSIKFYEKIFEIIGWKKIESNAFSNGETKIYFIEQDVRTRRAIGPRHLCFLATSRKKVDEVAKFLSKTKSDIIRGPLESRYRSRNSSTADFRDPDGYVVEVATQSTVRRK